MQVNVNNNRQRLRGGAAAPSAAHLAAGHSAGAEYGAQCHVLPLDWGDMPPLRGAACLKDATSSTDATHACGVWAEAHGWTMEQLCLLQHSEVGGFHIIRIVYSYLLRASSDVPPRREVCCSEFSA